MHFLKFQKILEITSTVKFIFTEAGAIYKIAALNRFFENSQGDLLVYLKRIPPSMFTGNLPKIFGELFYQNANGTVRQI